jgi:hypothetical protein
MSYATDEHFIRADIGITEDERAFLDILLDDFMTLPTAHIGDPNE